MPACHKRNVGCVSIQMAVCPMPMPSLCMVNPSTNVCQVGNLLLMPSPNRWHHRPSTPIATPSKHPIDPATNRPQEMRAVIIEDECIGCTKCIPACPVDAIVGTGKHMHTIFTDLCTGCELCLPPCPVDCIKLVPIKRTLSQQAREQEQHDLRQRYHTHLHRVQAQIQDKANAKPVVSMVQSKLNNAVNAQISIDADDAKATIETAKLRSKIKKLQKQLSVKDNMNKRQELANLQAQLSSLLQT